ncbi:MAG: TRAP transporter large permease [Chloroflexi bacterium]|nr:TRAP transporter large permease [Chloroflexota bacterium]
METYVWGIVGFLVLFLMLALKVPIAFSFIAVGFVGLTFMRGATAGFQNLAINAWYFSTDESIAAIPLFTLMGLFLFEAGITHDLFDTAHKWIGSLRGGLALATVATCTVFAATSGSSLAAVATIGVLAYGEMKKFGYEKQLSMGTILSGGTLAILIPPSSTMIIYGILADESIGKLFIGGIFPGLLLAGGLAFTIFLRVKAHPWIGPAGPSFSWKEKLSSLRKILPVLILIVVILGGLYGGLMVPTEGGAVGAFAAFLIAVTGKKLSRQGFFKALRETLHVSLMIYVIIIGVNAFQTFLVTTGLTPLISRSVMNLAIPGLAVVAIMLAIYILLGCIMDIVGMLAITVPIFHPIIVSLGFNPIWFGILVVIMSELGMITPPVGLNCFVFKNVVGEDATLHAIFASAIPFYVAILVIAAIVFFFPQIATFLPARM